MAWLQITTHDYEHDGDLHQLIPAIRQCGGDSFRVIALGGEDDYEHALRFAVADVAAFVAKAKGCVTQAAMTDNPDAFTLFEDFASLRKVTDAEAGQFGG